MYNELICNIVVSHFDFANLYLIGGTDSDQLNYHPSHPAIPRAFDFQIYTTAIINYLSLVIILVFVVYLPKLIK